MNHVYSAKPQLARLGSSKVSSRKSSPAYSGAASCSSSYRRAILKYSAFVGHERFVQPRRTYLIVRVVVAHEAPRMIGWSASVPQELSEIASSRLQGKGI